MKRKALGLAGALACAATIAAAMVALAAPARAAALVWRVKSYYPYIVNLEFYSGDARYAWPGGNRVYVIRDYRTHYYRLICKRGQKICLGAWSRGNASHYWGVGQGGRHPCGGCCFYCHGQITPVQDLR